VYRCGEHNGTPPERKKQLLLTKKSGYLYSLSDRRLARIWTLIGEAEADLVACAELCASVRADLNRPTLRLLSRHPFADDEAPPRPEKPRAE
jgi:hypothetical protein